MLKLSSHIRIEGTSIWEFKALHNCEIVQDIKSLTGTCVLKLPGNIKWEGTDAYGNLPVKRGDKITVKLGYDQQLVTRFEGFVKNVNIIQTPITIECEDSMFVLKLAKVEKKAFAKITLKELIEYLLNGTGIEFTVDSDMQLGNYRISKNTVAEELDAVKSEYGLHSYFIGKNLYVGLNYPKSNKIERFAHGKNIISENYTYQENIKLIVQGVSVQKNNKRLTSKAGDAGDGIDIINICVYDKDQKTLDDLCKATLEQYKQPGFYGDFTTFGEPPISKAEIADIEMAQGYRNKYTVKKVTTSFGIGGYRQKIELGLLLKQE